MSAGKDHAARQRQGNAATMAAARDSLRRLGYDIEPPRRGDPPHGGIVARRDLGDRSALVAVDAGGRFRAELTWLVGEWPSGDEIGGVALRLVERVTRSVSIAGQVDSLEQVAAVVLGLRDIAPWAAATGEESPPAAPAAGSASQIPP